MGTPYSTYIFYLYANISFNKIRLSKNLNTFSLRPHCGEAGPVHHLATSFLLSDSINHGINLEKSPSLLYLYYLKQIGLSISLSSNNYLFKEFSKNPFKDFFEMGMNVTISTDDPLQFHFTNFPLLEEYSLATQFFKLTECDQFEIARNSCLQSGFINNEREKLLGKNIAFDGMASSDMNFDGISNCRKRFRFDLLYQEFFLKKALEEDSEFKRYGKVYFIFLVDSNEYKETIFSNQIIKISKKKNIKILEEFKFGDKYEFHCKVKKGIYIVLKDGRKFLVKENFGHKVFCK